MTGRGRRGGAAQLGHVRRPEASLSLSRSSPFEMRTCFCLLHVMTAGRCCEREGRWGAHGDGRKATRAGDMGSG